MSARKVHRDGQYIWEPCDDGAVGRVTHTRGALFGGSPIVTETARDRLNRQAREWKARQREVPVYKAAHRKPRPRCGRPMAYTGETCARRPGHGWDCRSAASLEAAAAKRRTAA